MDENILIERIQQAYPDAVIDISGADCSFELFVVSEDFEGLNTLQRQKPVLALFNDELKSGKLHALSIKAKTPAELQGGGAGLVQIKL